jgi:flavin-dependent dehydrogenase
MNREQPSTTAVITAIRRGDHRPSDPPPWIPSDPLALMLAGPRWPKALQPGRSAFDDGTRSARHAGGPPRNRRATGFRWGLYDRAPLRRWIQGRLTLLGDAAHPKLPHLAQGVNQAIEDGVALATMLAAAGRPGVPGALLAYETLRRDRTARIQHDARLNGAIYDNSGNAPGSRHGEPAVRLPNRRWIYDYDIQAEAAPVAAALANG